MLSSASSAIYTDCAGVSRICEVQKIKSDSKEKLNSVNAKPSPTMTDNRFLSHARNHFLKFNHFDTFQVHQIYIKLWSSISAFIWGYTQDELKKLLCWRPIWRKVLKLWAEASMQLTIFHCDTTQLKINCFVHHSIEVTCLMQQSNSSTLHSMLCVEHCYYKNRCIRNFRIWYAVTNYFKQVRATFTVYLVFKTC